MMNNDKKLNIAQGPLSLVFLVQRSSPIIDPKGTKTFVNYKRSLLKEGWNNKGMMMEGAK